MEEDIIYITDFIVEIMLRNFRLEQPVRFSVVFLHYWYVSKNILETILFTIKPLHRLVGPRPLLANTNFITQIKSDNKIKVSNNKVNFCYFICPLPCDAI